MANIGNRPKSKIFVKKRFHNWILLSQGDVHLHCSLTVTNVVNFLICDLMDVGEYCWDIKISHMLEGKLPKLLSMIGVEFDMSARMFVSSAVA